MPLPLPRAPLSQEDTAPIVRDLHHYETGQDDIAALHARIEASFGVDRAPSALGEGAVRQMDKLVEGVSRIAGPVLLAGAIAALAFIAL